MMKRNNFGLIFGIVLLLVIFINVVSSEAEAGHEGLFDKHLSYDIYLDGGGDYPTVIKDVQIVGFKDIEEKLFLIIKTHGFSVKDVEGYIKFSSITAILPEKQFKVRKERKHL